MFTPEITITLGRSRQVVKRKPSDLAGNSSHSYKFSARNKDASISSHHKRLRDIAVEDHLRNVGENGLGLDRNDLRHKLTKRRLSSESRIVVTGGEKRAKFKGEFSGAPAKSSIRSNVLQHGPQSERDICFQRDPYREATRDLSYLDSSRNYYSTVTRDDLRQRSPARPTYNSGYLSPPTFRTEMQKVTSTRSIDPLGSRHACSSSVPVPARSTLPPHLMTLAESRRDEAVALFPSSSGSVPRSSFMVDMSALKQMGEIDLKDLGIPMGPRKKILQAVTALSRKQLPVQL
ncbi:uncharacterized protein LOC104908590 isoform X2 [Beta vulgaris subsp. vulgaris]|uniref:uncharacterized protein LOC104908590 isoform X2 n=1 Tax=Beta vulgaris subsp. vulgaris TaxID=3555 RepID=UPI0020368836|nr:uncharacterized protein LOC104908590 isoform X2 [Beta vulgaris subsp. vulgaris]